MADSSIQAGDMVWIQPPPAVIPRNMRTRAIVLGQIPDGWYKVLMTYGGTTRETCFPRDMLIKLEDLE